MSKLQEMLTAIPMLHHAWNGPYATHSWFSEGTYYVEHYYNNELMSVASCIRERVARVDIKQWLERANS